MSTVVPLQWSEVTLAAIAGVMRTCTGRRDGRRFEAGRADSGFERDIIGCIGEFVLSKHLNVLWSPAIGQLDTARGDVAGYQVRATTLRNGCLIIKPEDQRDRPFALVTLDLGKHPTGTVRGWAEADAACVDANWRDVGGGVHHAAWFVPQSHLTPITTEDQHEDRSCV